MCWSVESRDQQYPRKDSVLKFDWLVSNAWRCSMHVLDWIQKTNWYIDVSSSLQKIMPFLVELDHKALWALKSLNFYYEKTSIEREDRIYEFDKLIFRAYDSSTLYKENIMKYHDSNIIKREFRVGC